MARINLEPIAQTEGYPPVETWHPPFCGDMDLVIKANGDWVHEGGVIQREKMVTLFSRILWREADEYFLVTPGEKVRIKVEDVPFQIVRYEKILDDHGRQTWRFFTKTNDVLVLGVDSELDLFERHGEMLPYLSVRHGMWASIHRNVFYQLVEEADMVESQEDTQVLLNSAGKSYCLGTFHEM